MRATNARGQTAFARGIDIPQIRYFLAVAEHLNYTRAASALGTCSSTLSRQIHRLEDNLGVSFFERHRSGVRLTAAGRQFQRRTQQFIFEFVRAIDDAARAGRAEIGDLYLGIAPSILAGPLQRFLYLYQRGLPDVQLRCFEADHELLILALHEHRIDVAVGYADLFGTAGVHVMQLWDEHLYVALPEGHVFAKRHSLTWNEFANQTVVVRGWTAPPCAYKELARRLPTNMAIAHHHVSPDTILGLVAAHFGFAVVPASASAAHPGVVFRPIKEPDARVAVFAAWLDERDNPAKTKFIAELRGFAQKRNASLD